MNITFSTALTLSRIVLTPFIVWAMIIHNWSIAIVLFGIASLTDLLDGYFARLWDQETELGAYLDPLADKILITACYAVLVFVPLPQLVLPIWFLAIVLVKELALLIGAFYFGIMKHSIAIKPSIFGKLAMFIQSCLVGWMFACAIFGWAPVRSFYLMIGAALVLVVVSLFHYALTSFDTIVGIKK